MKTLQFNYNPYHSPEKCGLEIYQEMDLSIDTNSFDLFVIWIKNDDETLWWDQDSGNSSTNAPFAKHELKPITKKTFLDFEKALKNHRKKTKNIYSRILLAIKSHLKEIKNNKKATK